eukprot:17095-Heterococcus_DN1.PRE.3
MAQSGDTTRDNGTGGESIYEGGLINEQPGAAAARQHDARGLLSMANAGPGTETSQFYILFAEAAWLNDKHVVIGRMLEGEDSIELSPASTLSEYKHLKSVYYYVSCLSSSALIAAGCDSCAVLLRIQQCCSSSVARGSVHFLAIEACGQPSGEPSHVIRISGCGQLETEPVTEPVETSAAAGAAAASAEATEQSSSFEAGVTETADSSVTSSSNGSSKRKREDAAAAAEDSAM